MKYHIKIPKKLKVGAHIYKIIQESRVISLTDMSGLQKKIQLSITLDSHLPQSIQEEIFIHEVLHSVFSEAGYGDDENTKFKTTEEMLVERLTPVLYQILCDNLLQEER